jgi:hypothetical protein
MFISQEGRLPFPKVDPIRLPVIIDLAKNYLAEANLTNDISHIKTSMVALEKTFRDWFAPVIDTNDFPYMYFTNNGITQGLEFLAIHYRQHNIKLLQGDYFWLKICNAASEVNQVEQCDISYSSTPSAIDGNMSKIEWPSSHHILDGAYVGTTTTKTYVPNNTEILLLGFGKNLGLVELRSGLILSKKPIKTLEAFQKTFGHLSLVNHEVIEKICKQISILELATILKTCQTNFCNQVTEINLIPSDSAILSTSNDDLSFYKRPNGIVRIPLGESITNYIQHNTNWLP